jgi:phytoene synthase
MTSDSDQLFKVSSRTYFYSSLFFPKDIRRQVTTLYAFVRAADNFVDQSPQDAKGLHTFIHDFDSCWNGVLVTNPRITEFVKLAGHKGIQKQWIKSFFVSMLMDTKKTIYHTPSDTLKYIYGSAEVIGLMMARVLDLPTKSYPYAKMLGRSMQYINFIRDIAEDNSLNRLYFSQQLLQQYHLTHLDMDYVERHQDSFITFIHDQLKQYHQWQKEAEIGYQFIPRRNLIAIKTAADMYSWTAEKIYQNPMRVYREKVKPSKSRVVLQACKNTMTL